MASDDLHPRGGTHHAADVFTFSKIYRHYVLALLTLIYFVSYVDRQILSILLQSIKIDLNLSDTSLGALSGLAFGLFYTTLGVPVARLADRFNRRNIIAASIVIWSAMTALCGFAKSFTFLFIARIGVGIGEAGCNPPSHSIIADYYGRTERATALAILGTGSLLASFVGFTLGGHLNEWVGWRNTFIIVGLPGIAVGLLALLTLREPPRGHSDKLVDDSVQPGFFATVRYLFGLKTFQMMTLAGAAVSFIGNSVLAWLPAFFERTHGLSSGEIGLSLGMAVVFGGLIGILGGGFLSDRLSKRDGRWYGRVAAIGMLLGTPCVLFTFITDNPVYAFVSFSFAAGLLNVPVGPLYTITQGIAPVRMRATASAFLLLVANFLGIGCGPLIVGILSDILSIGGKDGLRLALIVVGFTPLLAAYFFWASCKFISRDFAEASHIST